MIDRELNYGRKHIQNFCIKHINDRENLTIVDLGAGVGTDLINIMENSGKNTFCTIDYTTNPNLEEIKKKCKTAIKSYVLNIEKDKLPFENKSVDIIIANQILEHCKNIFWIMHEVNRVLKVGGTMVVGVPNLASMHNRLLLFMGFQPTCIQIHSAHLRGFTKRGMQQF